MSFIKRRRYISLSSSIFFFSEFYFILRAPIGEGVYQGERREASAIPISSHSVKRNGNKSRSVARVAE